MERLTSKERNPDGTGISKKSLIDKRTRRELNNYASQIITKLADYEDAEEQGLLLRLPCKVGDTVYIIESGCSYPNDCGYNCKGCPDNDMRILPVSFSIYMLDDIGDLVFLTREAAEQALKEMEDD